MEAYIATDRGEKRGKGDLDASKRHLVKADFRYDEERDGFHCPGGQLLRLKSTRKGGRRVYQGDIEECRSCAYYRRCCRSKSGAARTITSDGKEPLRRAMNERMSKPESRAIYARRKTIVEPGSGRSRTRDFGDSGYGARRKWRGSSRWSAWHTISKRSCLRLCGERCVRSSGSERPGRKKGAPDEESASVASFRVGIRAIHRFPRLRRPGFEGLRSLGPLPLSMVMGEGRSMPNSRTGS